MTESDSTLQGRLADILAGRAGIPAEGEPVAGLPHAREIAMRLHAAAGGVAEVSVPYDPRLVGDPETGVLHGGVITTLLDTACGIAVMVSRGELTGTATLDLRIDYMRPARRGETVRARAECYRLTSAIAFARAVAYHAHPGEPIASAAGAFALHGAAEARP